ncbi:Fructosamine kinase PKL/CAK/FruK [Mycena kentingensis (nom. inval.)]|nr:Fructosamine kinase PKL/CAK/FruK [Mycena kentingensis (nom. inval.)]
MHPSLHAHLLKLDPGELTGHPPKVRSSSGKTYYAKIGAPNEAEQFAGEAESLKHIHDAAPGLAPRLLVFATDISGTGGDRRPCFISQYLDITYLREPATKQLAIRLARELHAHTSAQGFGFDVPTYCGATRLANGWFDSWAECFSAQIGNLLSQLRNKGARYSALCAQGERVCEQVIPKLLGPLNIRPALLHGDLWGGNVGQCDGRPVIFDPASYYGHNEADLAIGRIFGGFPKSFFDTYHEHRPKTQPAEQYELRGHLYELFHYLNHACLFGGHYASSAERKMDILLAAEL